MNNNSIENLLQSSDIQIGILTGIVNSIPDLIFTKDLKSRYRFLNTACAEFLNTDLESIIGKDDVELGFPQVVVESMLESDNRIYAGESKVVYDSWIPDANGKLSYYETTKAPIIQDGKVVGIVGISRDISEKYKMEQNLDEALTQANARAQELLAAQEINEFQLTKLRLMVEATKIGLWDIEIKHDDLVNPNNPFIWSDELRKMLGFTDENDFPNIFSAWSDRLHPEDKAFALESFENHLIDKTGQTRFDIEYRLMKKSGEYGHFRASGETIRDELGNPIRAAGALMDVTATKSMTEALSNAVNELKTNQKMLRTVNTAASALIDADSSNFETVLHECMKCMAEVVNVDRMYIWKNYTIDDELYCTQIYEWAGNVESQMGNPLTTGISYSEQIPRWASEFSQGKSINAIVRELPQVEQEMLVPQGIVSVLIVPVILRDEFWGFVGFDDCQNERVFTKEEESILRSGNAIFAATLLRNEALNNLHETMIRLEAALIQAEAANKAKSDFLSTVSHEIRTPMNAILGIAEIQLQNPTLEKRMREPFGKIQVSGEQLLGIINDILDFSKIEAGKLELNVKPYEIASLICESVQLNIMRIGSKSINFNLNMDENLPAMLSGDDLRLKQILNNLLSNAFKYTEMGSVELSVTFEPFDGDDAKTIIVYTVSDTGIGMTPEQVSHLFDEYSRFESSASRTTEGTGLGMGIVKSLVNLMEGEIFVESTPGEGSVFTVKIPQGIAGEELLGREMADNLRRFRTLGRAQMKRMEVLRDSMPYGSVLVVDDVESNIYVCKGLLAPYELNVDAAVSGFEAIEKIKAGNTYDIIFMDHMMPIMDGMEATRLIRELGYTRPIVALTANAIIGQADKFLNNGFDDFVAKPIDVRQLNAVLNKLVRDKQPPEIIEKYSRKSPSPIDEEITLPDIPSTYIVEAFLRDARKSLEVLDEINNLPSPLNDENIQLYDTHIHGMKSALANIGEIELSHTAYMLEMAVKDRNFEEIRAESITFTESLIKIVEALSSTDDIEMPAAEDDIESLREQLLLIKSACAHYDANTLDNAIKELREKAGSKSLRKLLSEIAKYLLCSEFDEIVESVDNFLGVVNE